MKPDALTAQLLATGPFERASAPFRLLEITGPDAGDFLQRLCTQDVLGLKEGQVKPAAFLDNKGKVLATCLVFRIAERFFLETQKEQEEQLAALLERYHFTEKLTIARASVGRPREVVSAASKVPEQDNKAELRGVVVVRFARRGVAWMRTYGGTVFVGGDADEGKRKPLTRELGECLRMGAGLVRVGLETEPSTLALEADLEDHCSTTKGCYTGQEIVARINTYGHVNRRLCLLHLPEGPMITTPVALHEPDDQTPVGRVMHAMPLPDYARRVGLGYLPKDFQKLGTKLALPDGVGVTVVGFAPAKS
jgi:folate-binding protein YgfZ